MTSKYLLAFASVLGLSACDNRPREVYVPVEEPQVELMVAASTTEASVGEPVMLYAERWNRGEWELVERKDLDAEQCWLRHPPEPYEKEVADNLRWEALPAEGVRFNVGVRSDHARKVIFEEPGRYTLSATSKIWCRPDQREDGEPIRISVTR